MTTVQTTSRDHWTDVAAELGKRVALVHPADAELIHAIEASTSPASPSPALTRDAARGAGVTVRAFWWGFHVEIDHPTLGQILDSADTVNTLVGTIGGAIFSPAQPWIVLVAKFVAGAHQLLRGLDRGNGIYISMSWFAPGVFVPTTVV
ncbi:hypothetical protein [Streptomyces deccanensis]|uniref:hypothetical protein n=1 Tax=Streptomyces deccanensis TaxID=424188 RepID=UPI001EFAB81B|nr:hypothetical protein [Streptomyces deccanensis]ULR55594.1 hypothetical protein L3078_43415 [Streptomyces deccanensis]